MKINILSLSFIWVCVCLSAFAQTKPRLLIGGINVLKSELGSYKSLESDVVRGFKKGQKTFEVLGPDRALGWKEQYLKNKEVMAQKNELQLARSYLSRGKTYVQTLKFKEASDHLNEARKMFIANLQHLRSNRDLLESHLYLGMSELALGQEDEALSEFKRVFYVDPTFEGNSTDHSPKILEFLARAKQEVNTSDPVELRITSSLEGALVYVNGKPRGKTPLTLSLQPSSYFILVEKENTNPWYKLEEISGNKNAVHADFSTDPAAGIWSDVFLVREGQAQSSASIKTVLDLANSLGADVVLLSKLEDLNGYRLLGQLLDVRTGEFSQVAVALLGNKTERLEEAAERMAKTLTELVPAGGSAKPNLNLPLGVGDTPLASQEDAQTFKPKKPWYKVWWIYPVIVGAGVGAFFGAKELGGTKGSKVNVRNNAN